MTTLWFLRHYEQSQFFHWSLTIFWALLAAIHWIDVRGPDPAILGPLVTTVPFVAFAILGLIRVVKRKD